MHDSSCIRFMRSRESEETEEETNNYKLYIKLLLEDLEFQGMAVNKITYFLIFLAHVSDFFFNINFIHILQQSISAIVCLTQERFGYVSPVACCFQPVL